MLNYLCELLEQEDFPRSYAVEFKGPEKSYLPITGPVSYTHLIAVQGHAGLVQRNAFGGEGVLRYIAVLVHAAAVGQLGGACLLYTSRCV